MTTTLLSLTDTFILFTAGIALVVLLAFSGLWVWAMRTAYKESGRGDNPNVRKALILILAGLFIVYVSIPDNLAHLTISYSNQAEIMPLGWYSSALAILAVAMLLTRNLRFGWPGRFAAGVTGVLMLTFAYSFYPIAPTGVGTYGILALCALGEMMASPKHGGA